MMRSRTWHRRISYALAQFILLLLCALLTASQSTNQLISTSASAHSPSVQTNFVPDATRGLEVKLGTAILKAGQQSTIVATLHDGGGSPVAGELVVFYGGLGTVSPASAVTDGQGRVSAVYTAGSRGGKAQVTVLAGYTAHTSALEIEGNGSQPGGEYQIFLPAVAR